MITTTDQLNRTLIFKDYPIRIISLVPSQTELLFALGLRDEVVGITKFCIHPEKWFRSKSRIGGTKNLNLKKIHSLKPDLIISNKEENEESQVNTLMKDFPVWISDIKTLEDALVMIEEISFILNKKKKGIDLINKIILKFETLKVKKRKLISCAYLIWKNPIMTVGSDTFISEIMQYAGFQNIFSGKERYPHVTINDLKTANPDVVFLSSEPYPFKEKDLSEFRKLLPVSEVLLVDGEMFSWYGSRLLKAPSYFSKVRGKIKSGL